MSLKIKEGGRMERRFWTAVGMLIYALFWPWLKWGQWRVERRSHGKERG